MNVDDVVAVIETDKVNVDIRTTHAGVIKKYFAKEGDTVQVDANFLEIDTDAKPSAAPQQAKPEPSKQPEKSKKVSLRIYPFINLNTGRKASCLSSTNQERTRSSP